MLLQSQEGYINIFLALQDKWSSGLVKWLKARGVSKINIYWQDRKSKKIEIYSLKGNSFNIKVSGINTYNILDDNNKEIELIEVKKDFFQFKTERDKINQITNLKYKGDKYE